MACAPLSQGDSVLGGTGGAQGQHCSDREPSLMVILTLELQVTLWDRTRQPERYSNRDPERAQRGTQGLRNRTHCAAWALTQAPGTSTPPIGAGGSWQGPHSGCEQRQKPREGPALLRCPESSVLRGPRVGAGVSATDTAPGVSAEIHCLTDGGQHSEISSQRGWSTMWGEVLPASLWNLKGPWLVDSASLFTGGPPLECLSPPFPL